MSKPEEFNPHVINRYKELGGNQFVIKMIDLFNKSASKRICEVEKGWEIEDYELIKKGAHGLRSSAGNFEANRITNLTIEIEYLADEQKKDTLLIRIRELRERYNRLQNELKEIRETIDS